MSIASFFSRIGSVFSFSFYHLKRCLNHNWKYVLIFFTFAIGLMSFQNCSYNGFALQSLGQSSSASMAGGKNIVSNSADLWFAASNYFPNHKAISDSTGTAVYPGSVDYMSLFNGDQGQWQNVAANVSVIKLYGEWVGGLASKQDLQAVANFAKNHNMKIAIEFGPLVPDPATNCGSGIEGFSAAQWPNLLNALKGAGVSFDYMEMDEPFYYGSLYKAQGVNTCNWSATKIAQEVLAFMAIVHNDFPNVVFSDVEPLVSPASIAQYQDWLKVFAQVAGYPMPGFKADISWDPAIWKPSNWPSYTKQMEVFTKGMGTKFGIIYTGAGAATNQAWYENAMSFIEQYQGASGAGGNPDQVILQSWDYKPDHALPETASYTFSNLALNYLNKYGARMGNMVCQPGTRTTSICSGDQMATCNSSGTGYDSCVSSTVVPATCSNGAVNIPLCSIDLKGQCLNGYTNPPDCTMAPTTGTVYKEGIFMVGNGIFYSNGSRFCVYPNWNSFVASTCITDVSPLTKYPALPTGMVFDKDCQIPSPAPVCGK